MEKYLLINNRASCVLEDSDVSISVIKVGSFDSIEECIEMAEIEILNQARDCFEDEDESEKENLIIDYCYNLTCHELKESDFKDVGDIKCVYEHWYLGELFKVENQFSIIRMR